MKISAQQDEPLSLTRILEEDTELLHGPLPPDYPAGATDTIRTAALVHHIHTSHATRAGLCLSGGGIRSATFGLGVLQSLARLQLLNTFDYLSTVSGGGYIGSWLTAWIHRHPRGLDGVINDLQATSGRGAADPPHPVQWLRNYSNYLSPHLGFFSADSWTLLGIYLRNLHLNWMVLLPLLMLPLLLPRWMIALAQLNLCEPQSNPCKPRLPDYAVPTLLTIGLGLAVMALIYLHLCRPTLRDYRHEAWQSLERQPWFLLACLIPLVAATICLTTASAWFRNAGGMMGQFTLHQAVLGGALIHTGSWLFATVALKRFKVFSWWLAGETGAVVATGALGGW
ncbi:MAG: patatin-like phospholipase family protein [Nitrospira sp.]|nr:patatin-like phospholipase family protein [Nitrospira sp.]